MFFFLPVPLYEVSGGYSWKVSAFSTLASNIFVVCPLNIVELETTNTFQHHQQVIVRKTSKGGKLFVNIGHEASKIYKFLMEAYSRTRSHTDRI